MKKSGFVITGGHHNSALVIARELAGLGHQVTWFGHRQASRQDRHDSAEFVEVTASGFPFYELKAGKLDSIRNFGQLPGGLLSSRRLLKESSPAALISFGSYLGLSAALAARALAIPVFLHEQTVVAGKANLLAASFARRIYLTWESSRRLFPASRSRVVGLPLRPSLLKPRRVKLFDNSLPTLVVLGGKLGSHLINQTIFSHLESFLESYNLIHQTGSSSATGDLETALAQKDALPPELSSRYRPDGYFGESEIGNLLGNCDLYLGRSGAHITYELGLLGVNSVLIPFPHTHRQEQVQNARFLESRGLAAVISERELSLHALRSAIRRRLGMRVKPLSLPRDATETMVRDILENLG